MGPVRLGRNLGRACVRRKVKVQSFRVGFSEPSGDRMNVPFDRRRLHHFSMTTGAAAPWEGRHRP